MPTRTNRLYDLLPAKLGIWLTLLVLGGGFAILFWMFSPTAASPALAAEEQGERVPAVGINHTRRSCPECGVVSFTRNIAQANRTENFVIEVNVRMKDGTNYRFIDKFPSNWHEGERMIVISGKNPENE